MRKFLKIGIPVLVLVLALLMWWRFWFVFGEGVGAGNLNFVVKKGYVFKTWEGRLIQTGFKSAVPGALQSNEFEFSVANDSLGAILERSSGKFIEVRYKEFLNSLPWRGMSRYVVVDILKVTDSSPATISPY
jgi:hypothetical protein